RIRLLVVEVAQVLAAVLHVLAQVEVRAIRDPLELAAPEREVVLDVRAPGRIVGKLVGRVLAQMQALPLEAELCVPAETPLAPVGVPSRRFCGPAEELDLHLLELAAPKREVAG